MGYALETSIKGSNGLCSWAVKGIPAARRNKDNVNQIKEDIITNVKIICIRVDPTNSVEETDCPKHYVASLNSDTNILMGVMNLSNVETSTSGYPEKIKNALSSIVLRAMQTTALSPLEKTEIPNYIKEMGVRNYYQPILLNIIYPFYWQTFDTWILFLNIVSFSVTI